MDLTALLAAFHANSMSLRDLIEAYLAELVARVAAPKRSKFNRSGATLAKVRNSLSHIPDELLARPAATLTRNDIKAWHLKLGDRKVGDRCLTSAADTALGALRSVLQHGIREQLIPLQANPCQSIEELHEDRPGTPFSPSQLERFRDALDVHLTARLIRVDGLRGDHPRLIAARNPVVALELADLTGARAREITNLRVREVRLEDRLILLETSKTDRGLQRPLSSAAIELLKFQLARVGPQSTYVFPMLSGNPLSYSTFKRVFYEVLAVAGLDAEHRALQERGERGFSPHSFRYTMITNSYTTGHGTDGIQGAAGHANPGMTWTKYRRALPAGSWDVVEQHCKRGAAWSTRRAS